MFGILTQTYEKPRGLWQKLEAIIYGGTVSISFDSVEKAGFAVCNVSIGKPRKRESNILRGLKKLRSKGVFRAIVEEELHKAAYDAGLSPITCGATLRACGYKCVMAAVQRLGLNPKNAALLLSAEKATRELSRVALELGARIKYVHVTCQNGGEGLNRMLFRELGMAEMATGQDFDCAVAFDNKCLLCEDLPVINLSGTRLEGVESIDFALCCQAKYMSKIPAGIDPTHFVSALYLCSAIGVKDIKPQVLIKSSLDIGASTQYNRE